MASSDRARLISDAIWISFWIGVDCLAALAIWHAAAFAGVDPAFRIAILAAFAFLMTACRYTAIPFWNWANTEEVRELVVIDLGFPILYIASLVFLCLSPFLSPREIWLGIACGAVASMLVWWIAGMTSLTASSIHKWLTRKKRSAYLDQLAAEGVIDIRPISEEERARDAERARKRFRPTLWQMWLCVLFAPALAVGIAAYLDLLAASLTAGGIILLGVLGSVPVSAGAASSLWPVSRTLRFLEKRLGKTALAAGIVVLPVLFGVSVDVFGLTVAVDSVLLLAMALSLAGLGRNFLPRSFYPLQSWAVRVVDSLVWCALLFWVTAQRWQIGAFP